jgi:hypothetical protein
MSLFEEMHRSPEIGSRKDYDELRNRIKNSIEQGVVKEISPSSDMAAGWDEKWFVEKSTGVVFRLVSPDPPSGRFWSEVEFKERGSNRPH